MSVIAVGDPTFIAGFKAVGAEGAKAATPEEAHSIVSELVKSDKYALIILPDRYVDATADVRAKIMKEGRYTPIFLFLPDYTGIKGRRIEELKKSISLAVGARLKI